MNLSYLTELIADKLHSLVCVYTRKNELVFVVNRLFDVNAYQADYRESMEQFLLDLSQTPQDMPLLSSVDNRSVYCTVPTPDYIFLIGPVCFFTKLNIRHDIKLGRNTDSRSDNIRQIETNLFFSYILLLRNLFFEKTITMMDILTFNCINTTTHDVTRNYYNVLFQNRENGTTHNSYAQEVRMLTSIETGNLELLAQTSEEDMHGKLGVMARSEDRSVRNLCLSVITLCSRAAIRGGVHPELAFSLCDSYALEIERTHSIMDLSPLVEEAKVKFCTMVKELKIKKPIEQEEVSYHPVVNKCKDYVYKHLHEKIVLQTIADELHINANYLSLLFRKCENISFTEFVMQKKVELAKSMLIYSSFSYAEIACQLGFVSQSHFGKHFREMTGITPKQYRDRFKADEPPRLKKTT